MIQIFDNFCPEIDAVRDSFLSAGFGTLTPPSTKVGSGTFEGMSFTGNHAPMIRALTQAVGRAVIPNRMFARITNESTEKAYIHSDRHAGDFTCIAYLSKHDEVTGTGFYRHKETSLTEMPLDWIDDPARGQEMVDGSDEVWDQLDFVYGLYNRAVIFSAPLFHSRIPINGIGTDPTTGRMVWACHFYIL